MVKLQTITKVITDNLSRMHVCNEREITKPFYGSYIGNVRNPNLGRSSNFEIYNAIFILIEPVQRIGCSGTIFFSKCKHLIFSKDNK